MSFPGPGQSPNNNGGGNNPFTNPFGRNNNAGNGNDSNGKGDKSNGNGSNGGPRPFWQSPWLWVVVVALLAVTMFQIFAGTGSQTIDTKDGLQILNGNNVEYAQIVDNTQQVKLKLKSDYSATDPDTGRMKNYGKNVQFYYTYAQSATVVKAVQKADPVKGWTATMQQSSIWTYLLTSLLPFLIIFGLFWFMMSRMGGAGGMFGMGGKKNSGKLLEGQTPTTKFADVAGEEAAVQEVEEIKDFLKDPSRYKALGARIPRGVLLYGPPGTGKTLLARAIAGEAGVPFYSMAGSDFVEMFVGLGASRVRDLFDEAKKNAPAIIFIDEIDAVGRKRGGSGMSGGHDEREQTLNQLLVEMDGFGANEGVIVIAATNRKDILDNALLRPGRFDRQVYVGAPDVKGREAILKVHARNKQFDPDVKFSDIAKTTAGFTGADLENLLNEAALLAARRNKKLISQEEIEESLLKVVMGVEKKSHIITEHDKRLTAYHEAGHAICFEVLSTQDPVHHVTIIPRSSGAGGFTMPLPEEDQAYRTKKYMEEYIVVCLGGRVAEKLTMEDISTGAYGDIKQATQMARAMVTSYGMSDKIGPIDYGSEGGEIFLGRDFAAGKGYSEVKAAEIDDEIHRIIETAYHQCEKLLSEHMDAMTRVAEYLIRNETMDGETFKKVFNGEEVPDKVVGADLMSELQKDLNEKIGEPAKAESAEPEQSENK